VKIKRQVVSVTEAIFGEKGPKINDIAEDYMEASKIYPHNLKRSMIGIYKLRQDKDLQYSATRSVKTYSYKSCITLPKPDLPDVSLKEILLRRRTIRKYSKRKISFGDFSALLQLSAGISSEIEYELGLKQCVRTVPSAGALYPLEIYCVVFSVNDILQGLYHFNPLNRCLEEIKVGNFCKEVNDFLLQPELMENIAILILITGVFWRTRFKYGVRGLRFVLMEAGHLAQNFLLVAEALNMAAVLIGGFYDNRASNFLEIDGTNEAPLYLISVGYKPHVSEAKKRIVKNSIEENYPENFGVKE